MYTKTKKYSIFDYINYTIMIIITFLTFYPFWYTFVISISTVEGYSRDFYHIIPFTFSIESYLYALKNKDFMNAFFLSVTVTVFGTMLSLFLTIIGSYVLSKNRLKGRNILFKYILFTMFFNGGVVPYFILVNKLGIGKTILAYFIPVAINTYNLLMMMNYFKSTPESLEESAKIDGANEIYILFKIVVPISKPVIATITIFYSVYYWNDFFQPLLFASGQKMYPLAMFLRTLISGVSTYSFQALGMELLVPEMIKASFIIISIIPIVIVYPFIQKYFVQGIMLGSIKE